MKKGIIISEELVDLFGLNKKCVFDKENIESFEKQVQGIFLLHKSIFENPIVIRTVFNNKNLFLTTVTYDYKSWRDNILGLGDSVKIYVYFKHKESDRWRPFWNCEYTQELKEKMNEAYSLIEQELFKIEHEYLIKYDVSLKKRLEYVYSNNTKWFYKGCKFHKSIYYTNEFGLLKKITDYNIEQSITQKNNIFLGNTHKTIKKLLVL